MIFTVVKVFETETGSGAVFQIGKLSIGNGKGKSVDITALVDQGKHFYSDAELRQYLFSALATSAPSVEFNEGDKQRTGRLKLSADRSARPAVARFRCDDMKVTIWWDDEDGFLVSFPPPLKRNPKAWEAFGRTIADHEAIRRICDGEPAILTISDETPDDPPATS